LFVPRGGLYFLWRFGCASAPGRAVIDLGGRLHKEKRRGGYPRRFDFQHKGGALDFVA
jgi:hypothetical protein